MSKDLAALGKRIQFDDCAYFEKWDETTNEFFGNEHFLKGDGFSKLTNLRFSLYIKNIDVLEHVVMEMLTSISGMRTLTFFWRGRSPSISHIAKVTPPKTNFESGNHHLHSWPFFSISHTIRVGSAENHPVRSDSAAPFSRLMRCCRISW